MDAASAELNRVASAIDVVVHHVDPRAFRPGTWIAISFMKLILAWPARSVPILEF